MKIKFLNIFIYVWATLGFLTVLASLVGNALQADSFWDGMGIVLSTMNPYNLKYYITVGLVFSPVIYAVWWKVQITTDKTSLTAAKEALRAVGLIGVSAFTVGAIWFGISSATTLEKIVRKEKQVFAQSAVDVDGTAQCNEVRELLITRSSGPCKNAKIPRQLQIGQTIAVDDVSMRINYIAVHVTSYDMPKFGLKAGQVTCVAVEDLKHLPENDNIGMWIYIPHCEPIFKKPS
ncbi:MAG: hypothetical protein KAH96_06275 [Alphaproteobacteria bacterium]|nr:hypothetical protein [Alphaproteobacteria bacterium]